MTSLQSLLPEPGSSNWRKSKSFSTDSNDIDDATVRHVVIREVWLENRPTPHAVYKVDVMSRSAHWSVFRRYREFYQLHQTMMKKYGIPKDLLPPRKLANSLSKDTLHKRREALEHFLQRIINSYGRGASFCAEILEFLDVKSHDVSLVTHTLSTLFKAKGEMILASGEPYQFTPSHLYCITRQLRLPHPWTSQRVDLAYLYDFVSRIQKVIVSDMVATASRGQQHVSSVTYDISLFTSLKELKLDGCQINCVDGFPSLPSKLANLSARYCVRSMKELFVDSATKIRKAPRRQSNPQADSWRTQAAMKLVENRMVVQPWVCLTSVNLSHNSITTLDSSFTLLPAIKELDLSYNRITHLDLTYLVDSPLKRLSLVSNEIYLVSGSTKANTELIELNLRLNRIHTIEGLLCMQMLESVDIANNSIVLIAEIRKLGALPRLTKLWIAGNPIAKRKRHRIMALYYFRTREFELDGKPMTSKERAKIEMKVNSNEDANLPSDDVSISTVSDDDLDSGIDEHGQASRLEPLLEDEYLIIGKDLEPIQVTSKPTISTKPELNNEDENSEKLEEDVPEILSGSRTRADWDRILEHKSFHEDFDYEETSGNRVEEQSSTLLVQSQLWRKESDGVSVFENLATQNFEQKQLDDSEVLYPPDLLCPVKAKNTQYIATTVKTDGIINGNKDVNDKPTDYIREGTLLFQSLGLGDGNSSSEHTPSSEEIERNRAAVRMRNTNTKPLPARDMPLPFDNLTEHLSRKSDNVSNDNRDQLNVNIVNVESVEEIIAIESPSTSYSNYEECERAEECGED